MWKLIRKAAYKLAWRCFLYQVSRRLNCYKIYDRSQECPRREPAATGDKMIAFCRREDAMRRICGLMLFCFASGMAVLLFIPETIFTILFIVCCLVVGYNLFCCWAALLKYRRAEQNLYRLSGQGGCACAGKETRGDETAGYRQKMGRRESRAGSALPRPAFLRVSNNNRPQAAPAAHCIQTKKTAVRQTCRRHSSLSQSPFPIKLFLLSQNVSRKYKRTFSGFRHSL